MSSTLSLCKYVNICPIRPYARVSGGLFVGGDALIAPPRPQARHPLASPCERGSAKRRRERRCTTAPSLLVRRGRCPRSGAKRNKYPWGASPRMPRQRRGIKPPLCKGRCQRFALTEGLSLPGEAEPRPYTRLPIAFAPSVRADVGIRPYTRFPGGKTFSTSGPWPPPTFAALRQRRDLIIATPRGEVSKGEGSQPLPFGRFKGKGTLRKGGNRNPPFLKWRSLVTFFRQGKKVTRRRQKGKGQKERKILHGRTAPSAPTTAYRAYALPQNIPIILPHLPPPRNLPSRASFM